jgi:squalene cyclase
VEGLVLSGEPAGSDALRRACSFLLSTQNPNGGWGEDFTSCYDKAYAANGMQRYGEGGSGVVNTAWALLALMAGGCDDAAAIARGVDYLRQQQRPNGDWKQEGIAGVFNRGAPAHTASDPACAHKLAAAERPRTRPTPHRSSPVARVARARPS